MITHILKAHKNGLDITVEADGHRLTDGDINQTHIEYTVFEVIDISGNSDGNANDIYFKVGEEFMSVQQWAEKNENEFEIEDVL